MNLIVKAFLFVISFFPFLYSCNSQKENKSSQAGIVQDSTVSVIFETDIGNDVDDALALDMLYKYADKGQVKILGISTNKDNKYSVPFIDILNTWYGYPQIPIGKVVNGANSENDSHNYAQTVCEYKTGNQPAFKRTLTNYANTPESVSLYRSLLSQQPDSSVVIISVGFSTNIARLLDSKADAYSNLNGKELVNRKVKLLSVMGGNFEGQRVKEYNIVKDANAARKVFAEWPTPIIVSPFEVGLQITYPASSIINDFKWTSLHPVVVAYKSYLPMPYDRPTWDLTAVLYAVEPNNGYFDFSSQGTISVDDSSYTHFKENPAGKHRYLKVTPSQAQSIKKRFIELITSKPKKLQ